MGGFVPHSVKEKPYPSFLPPRSGIESGSFRLARLSCSSIRRQPYAAFSPVPPLPTPLQSTEAPAPPVVPNLRNLIWSVTHSSDSPKFNSIVNAGHASPTPRMLLHYHLIPDPPRPPTRKMIQSLGSGFASICTKESGQRPTSRSTFIRPFRAVILRFTIHSFPAGCFNPIDETRTCAPLRPGFLPRRGGTNFLVPPCP